MKMIFGEAISYTISPQLNVFTHARPRYHCRGTEYPAGFDKLAYMRVRPRTRLSHDSSLTGVAVVCVLGLRRLSMWVDVNALARLSKIHMYKRRLLLLARAPHRRGHRTLPSPGQSQCATLSSKQARTHRDSALSLKLHHHVN
jgi:hypothetical protein